MLRRHHRTTPKILVIDDDPLVQSTLDLILREQGYKVRLAGNGIDGLRAFRKEWFDLVITDMAMPIKDGGDTIQLLRTWSPDLQIIAISGGMPGKELLAMATTLGASAVLPKPFEADDLMHVVTGCLAATRLWGLRRAEEAADA